MGHGVGYGANVTKNMGEVVIAIMEVKICRKTD